MGEETKSISQPGNFANSQITRSIKKKHSAVQDYFTKKLDELSTAVKQADKTAKNRLKVKQRATNRERQRQGNYVSDITGLQDRLWRAGYYGNIPYEKAVDGNMGKATRQAMSRAQNDTKKSQNTSKQKDNDTSFLSQTKQFVRNLVKSPNQATIDLILSLGDKAGIPTNATNYLRDLNVSLPYRTSSAIRAGWNTLTGNKNFQDNYNQALANPSWYEKMRTIQPLPVTNSNFNKDELEVLRNQSENGSHGITNADIIRTSGKYGSAGGLSSMFTPNKVAQLSIGQASGGDHKVTDLFDVNTVSNQAKKDNVMYIKKLK